MNTSLLGAVYPGTGVFNLVSPNVLVGSIATIAIAFIILTIIVIVGMMKVFKKAGKPGWAAIIPIYNLIVLLEIVGAPAWWIILLCLPILGTLLPLPHLLIPLLNIVSLVTTIMVYHRLAKAFGRGVGFTIGLLFLAFIFYPILGFGSAVYTPSQQA